MIPIIANFDYTKIIGNCDEKGIIQINVDVDFDIVELTPLICFKSNKQTGKILEKGSKAKIECLSLGLKMNGVLK